MLDIEYFPEEYLEYDFPTKFAHLTNLRFNAEQWIALQNLAKVNDKELTHSFDISEILIKIHYSAFEELLIVVNAFQIGLKSYKYNFRSFGMDEMMTHQEWRRIAIGSKRIDLERILYSIVYSAPSRFVWRIVKKTFFARS